MRKFTDRLLVSLGRRLDEVTATSERFDVLASGLDDMNGQLGLLAHEVARMQMEAFYADIVATRQLGIDPEKLPLPSTVWSFTVVPTRFDGVLQLVDRKGSSFLVPEVLAMYMGAVVGDEVRFMVVGQE